MLLERKSGGGLGDERCVEVSNDLALSVGGDSALIELMFQLDDGSVEVLELFVLLRKLLVSVVKFLAELSQLSSQTDSQVGISFESRCYLDGRCVAIACGWTADLRQCRDDSDQISLVAMVLQKFCQPRKM